MTIKNKSWGGGVVRRRGTRASLRVACGALVLLGLFSGCSDSSAPATSQGLEAARNALWALDISPHGLTMAIGETETLHPTARNILGDTLAIPVDTPVTYSVTPLSDTQKVVVDAQGVLTARKVTTVSQGIQSPVVVIGSWAHGGVTVKDTVYVAVTATAQPVAAISIQPAPYPADSAWTAVQAIRAIPVNGLDGNGAVIPNAHLFAYLYSVQRRRGNDYIMTPKTSRFRAKSTGAFWIYADGLIYGVPLVDSLRMTVEDQYFDTFYGFTDDAFGHITTAIYAAYNGTTFYLQPCGEQDWSNTSVSVPSVNVIFDDPNATGICVPGDAAGDIIGLGTAEVARKFPTPGLWTWHAVHPDGTPFTPPLYGAVLVRDHTFFETP